jgi:glyoxylase-like metal-dependent hydrolase (beta-lactamase superfamily II)
MPVTESTALQYPFDTVPAGGQTREVAPGVHWIRMPLPFALNHVNLWLLDDGDAAVVVDTGFGLDEVRTHWSDILARDKRPLSAIIATHCHPDHLGLAAWLAERDRTTIYMTQGEFLVAHAMWHQLPGYSIPDMLELFQSHGLDAPRLTALEQRGNGYKRGVPALPGSYHRIFDGDLLRIGGHEWQVIVGYGHAPEHASLYCAALDILISGDMLLPRISTNVSVFAATPHDDPLGLFLTSLQRIKHLPDSTLVLPSHGNPFRGLGLRIAQLEAHHAERCELLLSTLDGPRNAGEMLATLFTRELDTHQILFAMGETVAHLNYLVNRGQVVRQVADDGTVKFERTA